jgi:RNA polymerase sigma factor (sigma-70 family)
MPTDLELAELGAVHPKQTRRPRGPLTLAEANALAGRFRKLPYKLANRYRGLGTYMVDVLGGVGTLELVRSSRCFDPARNRAGVAGFAKYATTHILAAMAGCVRNWRLRRPIDDWCPAAPREALGPPLVARDDPADDPDAAGLLAVLHPRDRQALVAVVFHGKSMAELARELGVTRSRVAQYYRRATTRLRGGLGPPEDYL